MNGEDVQKKNCVQKDHKVNQESWEHYKFCYACGSLSSAVQIARHCNIFCHNPYIECNKHHYRESLRDETNLRIVAKRPIPNVVTIRRFYSYQIFDLQRKVFILCALGCLNVAFMVWLYILLACLLALTFLATNLDNNFLGLAIYFNYYWSS